MEEEGGKGEGGRGEGRDQWEAFLINVAQTTIRGFHKI